jgi:hypothetical protein
MRLRCVLGESQPVHDTSAAEGMIWAAQLANDLCSKASSGLARALERAERRAGGNQRETHKVDVRDSLKKGRGTTLKGVDCDDT